MTEVWVVLIIGLLIWILGTLGAYGTLWSGWRCIFWPWYLAKRLYEERNDD